jgi:hypothetical protein
MLSSRAQPRFWVSFLPFFLSPPLFWQERIDVRSLRPLVKEDEVDRDARRRSAEKSKSAKDSKKKGEKKKNLDHQALEAHRSKSRQRGEPEEESPSDDDGGDDDEDSDDSEGMVSRLDRILEGPSRGDLDAPRMGIPKEGPGGSHHPRADTPPIPSIGQVAPRPPPVPKTGGHARPQATGPLTRGRAAASEKGDTGRRSVSPGAPQAEVAGPRPTPALEGSGTLTRGGPRPIGRGTGRRAVLPVG